jgi:DNA excision repair protein ERCC-3
LIHEYRITKPSLHAAMSVGLETIDIINVLNKLSKIPLPIKLRERIEAWTSSYGKIRLVLKHNRYYLESTSVAFLQALIRDEVIGPCRVTRDEEEAAIGDQVFGMEKQAGPRLDFAIPGTEAARRLQDGETGGAADRPRDDVIGAVIGIDRADDKDAEEEVSSFEVAADKMEEVRRRCKDIDLPALEEYDFRNDTMNANLDMQLKPMTVIRPYQETSLAKMFGNGRARSGIIVLPCGAGKTLVGITAACTIKKSTLVLVTSA